MTPIVAAAFQVSQNRKRKHLGGFTTSLKNGVNMVGTIT